MNAQEAIENEQIELDELKSELKRREALVNAVNDDGLLNARAFQIEQVKMLKKLIEQKSIVLESAKVLNELIGNEEAILEGNQLGVYHDFIVHIPIDKAEDIGFEVDDNAT